MQSVRPRKGRGVARTVWQGVCAHCANTAFQQQTRQRQKRSYCALYLGGPPPRRQTLCMHPSPPRPPLQPKSRRYMPSRDPDPAALGEWLVKQVKAAVGSTQPSLHSNNIQHLPQHPPPPAAADPAPKQKCRPSFGESTAQHTRGAGRGETPRTSAAFFAPHRVWRWGGGLPIYSAQYDFFWRCRVCCWKAVFAQCTHTPCHTVRAAPPRCGGAQTVC